MFDQVTVPLIRVGVAVWSGQNHATVKPTTNTRVRTAADRNLLA
ncbi:hypothetical protein [Actinoplanes regularis]|nr:hypothetical protein [Actinoplanes regularis]